MTQPDTVDITEVVETQSASWFAISTFLLCCLVMLVDGFDNQAINYAAPLIVKDWGIDRELMTPVFAFSVLGWMLGSIGFSMIGDRIGRRNSILIAVLAFGVFTLAIPLARNYPRAHSRWPHSSESPRSYWRSQAKSLSSRSTDRTEPSC